MTDMKYSNFNSSETEQIFSSLIMTNWLLFFCAQSPFIVSFCCLRTVIERLLGFGLMKLEILPIRDCVDRVDIGHLSENTPLKRRLNFRTLDDTFSRRSNTLESPSLAGPRATYVSALPKFFARNPEFYFQMIEFIFEEHTVTTERARFTAVVTSLSNDQDIFEKIADIFAALTRADHIQFLGTAWLLVAPPPPL